MTVIVRRAERHRTQRRQLMTLEEKKLVLLDHYQVKIKQLGPNEHEQREEYEEKIDALKFHDREEMQRLGVTADLMSLPKGIYR